MNRAQCIVLRGDKLLMARHHFGGETWWCLPGGGVEPGETPAVAALRELREECCVDGVIIRETGRWNYLGEADTITFLVDIGNQTPSLDQDPQAVAQVQDMALVGVEWLSLTEIPERDRAYLWAAGLLGVAGFSELVSGWGNLASYPE
jgi:8-oxo-dGTP pyrophosphatase MutT (NUDIX family)